MKYIYMLTASFMLFFAPISHSLAQEQECGYEPPIKPKGMLSVERKPAKVGITLRLPKMGIRMRVIAHVIRTSDGAQGMTREKIEEQIALSNLHFANCGVSFGLYMINYIDDDKLAVLQSNPNQPIPLLDEMVNRYRNVECLNLFFLPRYNVSIGFSPKADGTLRVERQNVLFLGNSIFNGKPTNLIHELGHYFGLPHTFGYPNNDDYIQELVDQSNCQIAGDGFCDTPADMAGLEDSIRNCQYYGGKNDTNNDVFNPDFTNFMSYGSSCRTRFSREQEQKMIANYQQVPYFRNVLPFEDSVTIVKQDVYRISTPSWQADVRAKMFADINGDKKTDIVEYDRYLIYISIAQSDGTYTATRPAAMGKFSKAASARDINMQVIKAADVNGDGLSDLVILADSSAYVYKGKSDGTLEKPRRSHLPGFFWGVGTAQGISPGRCVLEDVTGEGRADLIILGRHELSVAVASGTGDFTRPEIVLRNLRAGGWTSYAIPVLFGDINGDHCSDMVTWEADKIFIWDIKNSSTSPLPKIMQLEQNETNWFTPGPGPAVLHDMNNDKMKDLVLFCDLGIYVMNGKDDGTLTASRLLTRQFTRHSGWDDRNTKRILVDFNGDGMQDIIGFGLRNVYIGYGKQDGSFHNSTRMVTDDFCFDRGWNSAALARLGADVNGDGISDIVAFGRSYIFTIPGNERFKP